MQRRLRLPAYALNGMAILTISGCNYSSPERNIIVDRPPFYRTSVIYREGNEPTTVRAVKVFAEKHGMEFLAGPGHPTLDAGQFNLTAASPTLNLIAIRVSTTLPDTEIYAISAGTPTGEDKALAQEFTRRLQQLNTSREPGRSTRGEDQIQVR